MKNKHFNIRHTAQSLVAITIIAISATNTALAAIVTSIPGIDVGGNMFTATIHVNKTAQGNTQSFLTIWDADGDTNFADGDGSIVPHAPTFFNDPTNAMSATIAVIAALGNLDGHGPIADGIMVPYGAQDGTYNSSTDPILIYQDENSIYTSDRFSAAFIGSQTTPNPNFAWVSFEPADEVANVPIPTALFMFVPGLLALTGFRKKHQNKA